MKGFSDVQKSRDYSSDPIDKHLNQAFELQIKSPRKRTLRCSGLPYCPILDTIMPEEPGTLDLKGALFTSMGSAAHSVIQLYMTLVDEGANVWGSWKCRKCKKLLKYQFRPDDYCCDEPMEYAEVDLRLANLTGHVDMIAEYNGKWILYEFKTVDSKPKYPKRMHQLQARHYVALLKLHHKIEIDAYTVIYIGRQYLERWKFGPYNARGSIRETVSWAYRAIRGFKAATKAKREMTVNNLRDVIDERPCRSRDDWDDYMSRGIYQFPNKSICPMLNACSGSDEKCLKAVKDVVGEY